MKPTLLLLLAILSFGYNAQITMDSTKSFEQNFHELYHPWMRFGTFIPTNMDECMIVLKSEPKYDRLLRYDEEEFYEHLFEKRTFGVYQSWDLKCHSALAQYFYKNKIYSVENIEATILLCFYELEQNCNYDFDRVISNIAETYRDTEKLELDLLLKEYRSEKKLHKKIKKKAKKEYKKAIKIAKKGEEFDLFYD